MFMKKIILASLFMAGLALSVNAQKNSVLVYGTVSARTTKFEPSDNKSSDFSFMPGIGYQFTNHWTAGIAGGFSSGKSESGTMVNKQNGYVVGPFVRYTKTLSNTFFFFSQLDAQYMSTTSMPPFGPETKTTGFGVEVTPAIGANVYKGLALNFSFGSLSYMTQKTKDTPNKTKSFGLTFGNQVNIGISKNF